MHPFIAYITAYSIMVTCNSIFIDIARKCHIHISKVIEKWDKVLYQVKFVEYS